VRALAAAALVLAVLVGAAPAGASDHATAKKLVIKKADVGPGYVVQPPSPSTDTFAQLAECVGKPVPGRTVVAHADGPALLEPEAQLQIVSNVDVVETKRQAKADRAVVDDARFPSCYEALVRQQAGAGVDISTEEAHVVRRGDYSTALVTKARSTSSGTPANASVVAVFIQKGRAELLDQFVTRSTTPFDRPTAEKILDKLAKRLVKAKV
jgi:hypothetical protein